jgi:hypothetical protein
MIASKTFWLVSFYILIGYRINTETLSPPSVWKDSCSLEWKGEIDPVDA